MCVIRCAQIKVLWPHHFDTNQEIKMASHITRVSTVSDQKKLPFVAKQHFLAQIFNVCGRQRKKASETVDSQVNSRL